MNTTVFRACLGLSHAERVEIVLFARAHLHCTSWRPQLSDRGIKDDIVFARRFA